MDEMDTRTKILTTARQLFYSIGYEKTSIQQIIDTVGIAKGTFYHHFTSKDQLLSEMVNMMADQVVQQMYTVLDDKELGAVEKFNKMMIQGGYTKLNETNFEIVYSVMKTLYKDENIILRDKMFEKTLQVTAPLLTKAIQQGMDSGEFKVNNPRLTALTLLQIGIGLNKEFKIFSGNLTDSEILEAIDNLEEMIGFFQESCGKLLGCKPGLIHIYEPRMYDIFRKKLVKGNKETEEEQK